MSRSLAIIVLALMCISLPSAGNPKADDSILATVGSVRSQRVRSSRA